MMAYLVHLFCPVARGSEEVCNKMRDKLIARGNLAKHLAVFSEAEWNEIVSKGSEERIKILQSKSANVSYTEPQEAPKCPKLFARLSQLFFWLYSFFR
jgi:hypothetical protein